jgi:ABC-type siderophore export system fused ATPase/permease subunit
VGSNTGIRYFSDFEEYLMILEIGLRQKKKSVINIIKQWDEKIFPNSDSSIVKGNFKKSDENSGMKKAMALLEADSEEEDIGTGGETA